MLNEAAEERRQIAYFEHLCDLHQRLPTPNKLPELQKFAGFSSKDVDELFNEDCLHPLDWFNLQKSLASLDSSMSSLMSETTAHNQRLAEAEQIKDIPQCQNHAQLFQACVHVASDQLRAKVPIVFDTGASCSLSPFLEDFDGPIEKPDFSELRGIANAVKIEGIGWVNWTIRDFVRTDLHDPNTCLLRPSISHPAFQPPSLLSTSRKRTFWILRS